MTKEEIIEYLYDNNVRGDLKIEDMADDLAEPQWIPCSETVDIPEEWVLACDEHGAEIMGYLSYTYDQWICESEHEIMYDPIAWRYLPEPWGGDAE